jgi:ABC-type glycerol-3-phosphate transport system substrate-binding protein
MQGRLHREDKMKKMSRLTLIGTPLGLAAAGVLARPYLANAQATTATVWINQGFVPAEDAAFRQTAAAYEKASGNQLDYNILPFQALNQKNNRGADQRRRIRSRLSRCAGHNSSAERMSAT